MKILDTRKVRKVGNSSVVTLPKDLLDKLNLDDDENLVFIEHDDKIFIQSATQKNKDFNSMLEQLTDEHDDVFRKLVDR